MRASLHVRARARAREYLCPVFVLVMLCVFMIGEVAKPVGCGEARMSLIGSSGQVSNPLLILTR